MKQILLIILAALLLLTLVSCTAEFTFRGSRFGDSMEQVKKAEGEDGETRELEGYQELTYQKEYYSGFKGSLSYYFKDDELQLVMGVFTNLTADDKEHIEDVYHNIKQTFNKYGTPAEEESLEYTWYQALWEQDEYGLTIIASDNVMFIVCSSDPSRAKGFYNTYQYTSLFCDPDDLSAIRHMDGPDFYNDSYDISSFIPIPKEGYEYTVRNSINEEELSILKRKPSIRELISAFGYPLMAEIYRNPVMDNGEIKYVKEYHMRYLVGTQLLGVDYDENCNFIKVHYDKSLTDIPEANDDLNIEEPIGVVRNDISRDELSFIDSDTTPEELQSKLGAPHRECYNGDLFRRTGVKFIRFFMSSHFLYPLKDGGVLDVRYSKGKDKNELDVSKAYIYEDSGEWTVLADYEW